MDLTQSSKVRILHRPTALSVEHLEFLAGHDRTGLKDCLVGSGGLQAAGLSAVQKLQVSEVGQGLLGVMSLNA